MNIGVITVIAFSALVITFLTGLPICFSLGGVAMALALWLWGPESMFITVQAALGSMMAFILMAIPLFILLGNVLERSGIADALYEAIHRWMGPLRGGLAIGTVIICTMMAAMVGVIGAGIVTMGIIALPAMMRRGYQPQLVTGSIMAGGSLGALIPPSVGMMLYCLIARQSVGRLFMGGVIPGLILSALYCTYIAVRSYLQPQIAPALPPEERGTLGEKIVSVRAVILPVLIIIAVLGSIFFGLATPTESAAVGAFGTIVAAAIHRRLSWQLLKEAAYRTVRLFGMVMWILIGASVFTRFYFVMGGADLVRGMVAGLEVSPWVILIVMQLSLILMGMVMEDYAIIMIAGPIYTPIVIALGFDPLWWGILFIINMQIAVLTPPYGFALFYMRGVTPESISMGQIYRSVIPFVILQMVGLILVMLFPVLATWLPGLMFEPLG